MATIYTIEVPGEAPPAYSAEPLYFPDKMPGARRSYGLDMSAEIGTDLIDTVSVEAAPSGQGELTLNYVGSLGNAAILNVAGGAPGRVYQLMFTYGLTSGDTLQYMAYLRITLPYSAAAVADAPSDDFGTPVTWTYQPDLELCIPSNSGYMMMGW